MENMPAEVLEFYSRGKEAGRLGRGIGLLEFVRTQELIRRFLQAPPATIADIGGGPGTYSCWLASLGYEVHLLDITPLHIEQAREASSRRDARNIPLADNMADAVLLHGPLYHLTESGDRLQALSEAKRILQPGGTLLAFGITRYSSALVGIVNGWVNDWNYRSND